MNAGDRTPQRHPSEATLLAHASGSLGVAHRFVVATHAMNCADCHNAILAAERIGGVLLDGLAPTALQPEALRLCLARLETATASTRAHRPADPPPRVGKLMLPPALHGLQPGKLRWLAPGVRHATLFKDERGTLHLLRVNSNMALPQHSHRGLELACVLQGACHDESGQYLAGDVSEVGDEDETAAQQGGNREHLVVTDPPGDCVCILATTGRLRFRNPLVRLLQPIMPF